MPQVWRPNTYKLETQILESQDELTKIKTPPQPPPLQPPAQTWKAPAASVWQPITQQDVSAYKPQPGGIAPPQESKAKDIADAFRLSFAFSGKQAQDYFTNIMPQVLFPDVSGQKLTALSAPYEGMKPYAWSPAVGKSAEKMTAENRKLRKEYLQLYEANTARFNAWVKEHPELAPREEWSGSVIDNIKKNPKLLADPAYWAFVAAQSAAPTVLALGTTILVSGVTGNPFLGLAAATAMLTPSQTTEAYNQLIAAGAKPDEAAKLSVPIGMMVAAVENAGDLPVLTSLSKPFQQLLHKNIVAEVSKQTFLKLVGKGIKKMATTGIAEGMEEVVQQAIMNAAARTVNENQSLAEGLAEGFVTGGMAGALLGIGGALGEARPQTAEDIQASLTQVRELGKKLATEEKGGIQIPQQPEPTVLQPVTPVTPEISAQPGAVTPPIKPEAPVVPPPPAPPPTERYSWSLPEEPDQPITKKPRAKTPTMEEAKAETDPMRRFSKLAQIALPFYYESKALRRGEKGGRVGVAQEAFEKAGGGLQGFYAQKQALKGEYERVGLTGLGDLFTQNDINTVINTINETTAFTTEKGRPDFFQKFDAVKAFLKLINVDNSSITPSENKLLVKLFGEEIQPLLDSKKSGWRKAWENFIDAINIPRSFQTIWDASAVFRQLAVPVLGEPERYLWGEQSALYTGIRSLFDAGVMDDVRESISANKYYDLAVGTKLNNPIEMLEWKPTAGEETMVSKLVRKYIPGAAASERSYATTIAKTRFDLFYRFCEAAEGQDMDMDYYNAVARLAEVMTGRGSLKAIEGAMPLLTATLYSPRWQLSRLQLIPRVLTAPGPARKIAYLMTVRFAGTVFLATLGMKMALGDKAELEIDPRSSDFMKLKVGDTRFDLTAGMQRWVRLISQVSTGTLKSTTTGEIQETDRMNRIFNYVRGTLSPPVQSGWSILSGKTLTGEELQIGKELYRSFLPFTVQDTLEALQTDGWITGFGTGAASFVGIGTMTYVPEDEAPPKVKPRPLKLPGAAPAQRVPSGNVPRWTPITPAELNK